MTVLTSSELGPSASLSVRGLLIDLEGKKGVDLLKVLTSTEPGPSASLSAWVRPSSPAPGCPAPPSASAAPPTVHHHHHHHESGSDISLGI